MQTKSWFCLGATLFLLACSSSKSQPASTTVPAPAIVGTYVDDFESKHTITADSWTITSTDASISVFYFTQVDNTQMFLIAHNDRANPYSADLWSQFDWTRAADGGFYYCQIAYKANSEQEASQTAHADANNLTTGCNKFSWSKLMTPAPDAGTP